MTDFSVDTGGNFSADSQSQLTAYEGVLTAADYALLTLNSRLNILTASPNIADVTGRTAASLIGTKFAQMMINSSRTEVEARLSEFIVSKKPRTHLETRINTEDGKHILLQHTIVRFKHQRNTCLQIMIKDITLERQKQDRAAIEQQRYQQLFESTFDAIAVHRGDELVDINPAFERLFGYSREDAIGLRQMPYIAEEEQPLVRQHLQLFSNQPRETIGIRHDGSRLPMEIQGKIIVFQGEQVFYVTIRDITARKAAEDALRISEARNRALLETLPDMMFVMTRDGQYTTVHVNDPEEMMVHVGDPEQLDNPSIHNVGLPENVVSQMLVYIAVALENPGIQSFEYTIFKKRNEPHYYEARLVALNDDEVLATVRNITPLKHVEQELNQNIADLVVLRQIDMELSERLNLTYVLELALDSAIRLGHATGGFIALYDEERAFSLAHVIGHYNNDEINALLQKEDSLLRDAALTRDALLVEDVNSLPGYHMLMPDTCSIIIVPLYTPERIVAVLRLETHVPGRFDMEAFRFMQLMTGRIAANVDNAALYRQSQQQLDELQRLYAEVSKLEQLKTDMIRIASHDLRNPLAGILGYLEMLKMEVVNTPDNSAGTYIAQVEQAARQMQRITTGILSLERIEQMANNSTAVVFNFAKLVRSIHADHLARARQKQQTFELEMDEQLIYVNGDSVQLEEALANLVSNAIKYTPDEGKIVVKLGIENNMMVVQVTDTGYGIPEAQQKRLFTPFFRAKTEET
ncbi:MAG: PAS domain S-box protein, partial [Aggregatilineales bacterium]